MGAKNCTIVEKIMLHSTIAWVVYTIIIIKINAKCV